MAYTPNYTAEDIPKIGVDTVGHGLAFTVQSVMGLLQLALFLYLIGLLVAAGVKNLADKLHK